MRSTIFHGNQLNPGNIIDFHLENLGKLVFGIHTKNLSEANPGFEGYLPITASHDLFNYTDQERQKLISDLHNTMNALTFLKLANDDFTPPITKSHIQALINTPAIVNTWAMIMAYKPLQHMSPDRSKLITYMLADMQVARREKMDRLRREQISIDALMDTVTKRQRPVAEFAGMKQRIDMINRCDSTCELENRYFNDVCDAIAHSEDPELAFEQIYSYIVDNKKRIHSVQWQSLYNCKASKDEFNRFFGQYGYQPENTPRQVCEPNRFDRYGEYDKQQLLHPGYQR